MLWYDPGGKEDHSSSCLYKILFIKVSHQHDLLHSFLFFSFLNIFIRSHLYLIKSESDCRDFLAWRSIPLYLENQSSTFLNKRRLSAACHGMTLVPTPTAIDVQRKETLNIIILFSFHFLFQVNIIILLWPVAQWAFLILS